MNRNFKALSIPTMTILMLMACGTRTVQTPRTEQVASKIVTYQTLLGKSVSDEVVADFILSNNCSSAGQVQVCKNVGMALWIDAGQIVKTVYMYSGNADGFERYRGELPYGLTFYDPMWLVEDKLSLLEADDAVQTIEGSGQPDEESSPDRMHYRAAYKRFNMVIIYDSPVADEDAYIYAVLVNM